MRGSCSIASRAKRSRITGSGSTTSDIGTSVALPYRAAGLRGRATLVPVGVRSWFYRLLERGEAPERDVNEIIEVADVPLSQGPLLIRAMKDAGIDSTGIESFDVVTDTRTRFRVMVRRADAVAAAEIVDRFMRP